MTNLFIIAVTAIRGSREKKVNFKNVIDGKVVEFIQTHCLMIEFFLHVSIICHDEAS